ncbi:MAG: hypothetical protein OER96_06920 [Gammaproteobacteria bacterium]|nr:hypothetical protein [Gammaproteobacteria bacterium]
MALLNLLSLRSSTNLAIPLLFGIVVFTLLAITFAIYWPGLNSDFLLDDFPNLEPLGRAVENDSSTRFKYFILSGSSSFLGRPLSLATFWMNDQAWPSDAWIFKYTNVLLHLLVGTILVWCLSLLCLTDKKLTHKNGLAIAIITSGMWLLHPLNVSTVLYVVQRMSQLSSLFILLGLLGYLKGRILVIENPVKGYLLMTSAISVAGALGVLSKENAALLPIFILSTEYTLIRGNNLPTPRGWGVWSFFMLISPVLLLVGWHVTKFSTLVTWYNVRSFSMTERLMTQTRVLSDYVGNILIPRRIGTGVHQDDFIVSTSLTEPVTTLVALVAIFMVVGFAIALRSRLPVFSFAVFWFIGGHLLEAGIIPLEIYFEHRNYLPMIGPLFAVSYGLFRLPIINARFSYVFTGFIIAVCGFATWQNTTLWRNAVLMAEVWADEHPYSARAQQFSADQWAKIGRIDRAKQRIEKLATIDPNNTSAPIQIIQLTCLQQESVDPIDFYAINNTLESGSLDFAVPKSVDSIAKLFFENKCKGLKQSDLLNLIHALLHNPNTRYQPKILAHLHYIRAQIHARNGAFKLASDDVRHALTHDPIVGLALFQTSLLLAQQRHDEALRSIELAKRLDKHPVLDIPLRSEEIAEWEDFVKQKQGKDFNK